MSLAGRVAVVSGAAGQGLGRSIALTLGREGAAVVVNYRTGVAEAAAIVAQIEGQGGRALAVAADVYEAEAARALIAAAEARFGHVDICIIGPGAEWHAEPIERLSPELAAEDMGRETARVLTLMTAALPGMYARGWGRIIGIASHPIKRSPAYAYNAAKAARLQALLLAEDQAWAHGVTVNVIAPGPVNHLGDLAEAAEYAAHGPAWAQRTNVSPQDMAEGVAFLCSEAGAYVTGCVLPYMFH